MTTATINKTETARTELLPLLTIEDLEQVFRVDRRTIRRWWKSGLIPAPFKLGGSNRWKTDEIVSALDRLGEGKAPASGRKRNVA